MSQEENSAANTRVLFVVAHPFLGRSRLNRAVTEAVRSLEGVCVRRLYDLYPEFRIDVEAEQKLLHAHPLVVIQHPLYWYSMPALLKQWLDEVFHFGWAYGQDGNHLEGKGFLLSLTVGDADETHCSEEPEQCSMDALLAPWKQTVHRCGMHWHAPSILQSEGAVDGAQVEAHAQSVRERLQLFLREGRVD